MLASSIQPDSQLTLFRAGWLLDSLKFEVFRLYLCPVSAVAPRFSFPLSMLRISTDVRDEAIEAL